MRLFINIAASLILCSSAAFAQDETPVRVTNQNRMGELPYSTSVGTQIEHVDLATGALNVNIPIWSVPGRGMDAALSFRWNSNYFLTGSRTDAFGHPYFIYAKAKDSGWQGNHPFFTFGTISRSCTQGIPPGQPPRTVNWLSNYIYYDEQGGQHQLPVQSGGGLCGAPATPAGPDLTAGGIWGTSASVKLADGTQVSVGGVSTNPLISSLGAYKDANGNTRASNSDTLGRSLYTAVDAPLDANGRPTQTTFTVKDANGNPQNIVVVWQPLTLNTSFGTSGVREATGLLWYAIQSITFPNGTAYHFHYEPDYGELTEIDLPSGGVITYTWANYNYPNPTGVPPDQEGRRYVASRTETVNGVSNTWTFQLTNIPTMLEDQSTVTFPPVLTPSGTTIQNQSVFLSVLGSVIDAKIYSGAATGTPVREYNMQYQSDQDPTVDTLCDPSDSGPPAGMPMGTRLTRIITILDNGLASKKEFAYDSIPYTYYPYHCDTLAQSNQPVTFTASRGNITAIREYGFGSASGPVTNMDVPNAPLLRTTTRTYLHDSNSAYLSPNIVDKVASEVVTDNVANLTAAQTQYSYDLTAIQPTTNLAAVPAHDSTFTSAFTTRGNPTHVQRWNNQDGSWLTTTYTYDDLGNMRAVSDPKGNSTSWLYDDSFDAATNTCAPASNSFAYVSKKTDAAGHNFFVKRRACTGHVHSHQDDNDVANGVATSYSYDKMGRVLIKTSPNGGTVTTDYHNDPAPPLITTTTAAAPDPDVIQDSHFDGFNRVVQTQLHAPGSNVIVDTTYDPLGRVATVSNPHAVTPAPTDGLTSTVYDTLSRPLVVTRQDGGIATTSYSGNCTTAADEAGKSRKSCVDALGRLTQVFEDPAGFNYETDYQYDVLGNLLRVDQKGSAPTDSTQWRTRLFTYDSLSRLLTASNPESNTALDQNNQPVRVPTRYSYDPDGNLSQKTSLAANQTGSATTTISYCYDSLNRLTAKGYANSPSAPQQCSRAYPYLPNPAATNTYDAGTNGIGRLTSLTDQAGSGSYTYDLMGRIKTEQRIIAGVSKTLTYDYTLNSSISNLHYPSGATVAYTYDSGGRAASAIDSGHGINYVTGATGLTSSATYGPDGSLSSFVNGYTAGFAGITSVFSNNKRLQPINMSASAPSQTVFSIGYDFHLGSGNNGNVYGITNYKDANRNQTFTYDPLDRLISAQNAGADCTKKTLNPNQTEYWGNSYVYDAWGNLYQKNITKCSAENLDITIAANNWISTAGYSYDAAGNMTVDGTDGVSAIYDAENRIATATKGGVSTNYTYDADGNRVKKSNGSTGTLYWYMTPGIVAESDLNGATKSEYVFFNGERVARRDGVNGAGGVFYYFSDHLKTASVVTDSAGNIKSESDYYPWGGELQLVNNDSNHYKFTGKERDSETQLDYFGARYYSNGLGRFLTPDWAAKATAVPYAEFSDPQSLNLYTYVRNLPTTKADADGHCFGDECSNIAVSIKVTSSPAFRTNEKQKDGTYETGVRGQLTITLTQNGKPMVNVPVQEHVTSTTTVNGKQAKDNLQTAKNPVPTNSAGQVKDDVGRQLPTGQAAPKALVDAVKADQTTNAVTAQSTQTLTFAAPNGATCSATYQRTLSNVDSGGNINKETDSSGSNYTLKTTQPKVKPEK